MRGRWSLALAAAVALLVVLWAITFFGPRGLVPRVLGTGGFVTTAVRDAPHPYAFDRPRLWDDFTDELHNSGERWDALVLGPSSQDGGTRASLSVVVRPTAGKNAEYPVPGGPFDSLQDFVQRLLPEASTVVESSPATVAGATARDVSYDYTYYQIPHRVPEVTFPMRGRALFFEANGYYYMLDYQARDIEFDRYAEVLDRAVSSFGFLN